MFHFKQFTFNPHIKKDELLNEPPEDNVMEFLVPFSFKEFSNSVASRFEFIRVPEIQTELLHDSAVARCHLSIDSLQAQYVSSDESLIVFDFGEVLVVHTTRPRYIYFWVLLHALESLYRYQDNEPFTCYVPSTVLGRSPYDVGTIVKDISFGRMLDERWVGRVATYGDDGQEEDFFIGGPDDNGWYGTIKYFNEYIKQPGTELPFFPRELGNRRMSRQSFIYVSCSGITIIDMQLYLEKEIRIFDGNTAIVTTSDPRVISSLVSSVGEELMRVYNEDCLSIQQRSLSNGCCNAL